MPQLSPLNWIFLYALFWGSILLMSGLVWWFSKIYFESKSVKPLIFKEENKWGW